MNARNRIFVILGLLFILSPCWDFFSTKRSDDLQLIGTVDANEVIVSSRIPGRIETLKVDEGDSVQVGQLIATIQSDDLDAARNAAEATAIAIVDPFTYAVHGLKSILLKDGGFVAIRMDLPFLFAFGAATLLIRNASL